MADQDLLDRFMSKVVWNGDEDECWEWEGAKTRAGYGRLWIANRADGKYRNVKVHRLAYELFVDPVPDGLCVLHSCDNPPCVNPNHLFLGTQLDNIADMDAKGRRATALNAQKAAEIRSRYSGRRGELTALAREFDVAVPTVHAVVNNRTWKAA